VDLRENLLLPVPDSGVVGPGGLVDARVEKRSPILVVVVVFMMFSI